MADKQLKATLVGDASQFVVEMNRATKANSDFMTIERLKAEVVRTQEAAIREAQAAAAASGETLSKAQINAINKTTAAYVQQAQKLEYSADARRAMLAEQLGITSTIQPFIDKINESRAAMQGAAVSAVTMGESEAEAAARISAMVQSSLAASAAMSTQAETAARYAASVDELAAAATAAEKANAGVAASANAAGSAQTAAATRFKAASTEISASAAAVAEALGRQLTAVTATTAEMAVYDAQMAGFTEAEVAQIAAISKEIDLRKQQLAMGEKMAAMYAAETAGAHGARGATSALTAEIGVLGREAANGNFTKFASSFTRFLSLGGALDLLLNPLALSVAAVGAAMYMVADQSEKLNESIILTGGYAGVTADELRGMANAATEGGATFNTAASAVTALAGTGRLTGEEIASLGRTVADVATYTSISAQKMVDEFSKLADDPVKASVKLNDQYHYLTAATYDQIVALEKQGDATGAAQVAVEAFSSAMESRTQDIAKNQGVILSGWREIKAMINGAIEAVGSFGAAAGPGEVVARLEANKNARSPIGQWSAEDEAELQSAISSRDKAESDAREKARKERQQQELIDAKHSYEVWNTQFATPADKRAKEIQSYIDTIATPLGLSPEQQLSDEDKINSKYKDPKQRAPKAYTDDAATRMLESAKETYASLTAQLTATEKIGTEMEKQVKFEQLIADLKEKRTLTADQKSLLANQAVIDAALKQNSALEQQNKIKEDGAKLDARAVQIFAQIGDYQQSQREQYDRQLGAIGLGADAQKQAEQVKSIYTQFNKQMRDLNNATAPELMNGTAYLADKARIQAGLQESLDEYSAYYSELKAKQRDWTNGAATATADYLDDANNRMKQTEQLFNDVTGGMEGAWVSFTQTGKSSFSSLANSVIADLARMQAKAAISGLLGSLASIGGSLAGGFFGANTGIATTAANALPGDSLDNLVSLTNGFGTYAEGGVLSGPGTGTSDDIIIRASNGEGILTAATVSRIGEEGVHALNNGATVNQLHRFATGGVVGGAGSSFGSRDGDIHINAPVTVQGGSDSNANASGAADLQKKITAAVRAVVVNERRQGGALWKLANGIA
ncbi:phage tail tape measure protein [Burkholderia gladioli]|uniref:phage tail tape measure protein n=1 Tax=Burkholderia gladioli TaxID=28095 RepID=UPI00163E91B2|nr:phage tail tape measure protein [Burkholderia gladioli]